MLIKDHVCLDVRQGGEMCVFVVNKANTQATIIHHQYQDSVIDPKVIQHQEDIWKLDVKREMWENCMEKRALIQIQIIILMIQIQIMEDTEKNEI